MSSHQAIAGDSSVEAFASGTGVKGGLAGGLRLGDRVTSIPRDGSMLDVSGVVRLHFRFSCDVCVLCFVFREGTVRYPILHTKVYVLRPVACCAGPVSGLVVAVVMAIYRVVRLPATAGASTLVGTEPS